MKNKEELIEWFNNIFNNCYYVTHNDYPDKIFMYYDLRFVRKLKLSNIEKKECLPPKIISGECVFEQDWKNKYLWCKYGVIWKYLEDNYSSKYEYIQQFIINRISTFTSKRIQCFKYDKMNKYTHFSEEQTKIDVTIPKINYF